MHCTGESISIEFYNVHGLVAGVIAAYFHFLEYHSLLCCKPNSNII